MMKRTLAALLALPALFLAAAAVHGGAPAASSGQALYNRYGCYACHGYVGAGGAMSGPALAGRGFDRDHVMAYVRAPKGVMPLYRKSVLPDAELARIADYVVALKGARPAAAIPDLARLQARVAGSSTAAGGSPAAAQAAAQFASQCAGCHGSAGEGGAGPSLRDKPLTADRIAAIIRNPPPGMPRLTPAPIPDADLADLARYVAGLATSTKR